MAKYLLFANTDWFLYNFRLAPAQALQARGDEVVLVSPPGRYASFLQECGFRWVPFDLERKGMNPLTEFWTIIRLAKLYRREHPDVVHHFTIKCVLYGTIAARWASTPAVINSLTGLGYVFMQNRNILSRLIGISYLILLRRTGNIFENPDDRRFFLNQGWVDPVRSTVICGAGVDLDHFALSPEPVNDQPVVMLAARMLWDKGVGEFVEAAKILKARNVQARFVLVGDSDPGNPTGIPLDTLAAWQAESWVEWWGWHDDMAETFRKSNVVCLPSYREGLPKTLIEAAAIGRALVTTDVPGCREVVLHGQNGFLVPSSDPLALANALETLIADPALRGTMAQIGREHVSRNFDLRRIIEQTLQFYDYML